MTDIPTWASHWTACRKTTESRFANLQVMLIQEQKIKELLMAPILCLVSL